MHTSDDRAASCQLSAVPDDILPLAALSESLAFKVVQQIQYIYCITVNEHYSLYGRCWVMSPRNIEIQVSLGKTFFDVTPGYYQTSSMLTTNMRESQWPRVSSIAPIEGAVWRHMMTERRIPNERGASWSRQNLTHYSFSPVPVRNAGVCGDATL